MSPTVSHVMFVALVAAGAFVLFAAVLSFWKFERLMHVARGDKDRALRPRDAFLVRIAAHLAMGARRGVFVLAVAEIPESTEEDAAALVRTWEAMLRRDADEVFRLELGRIGLLVAAPAAQAAAVLARLRTGPVRMGVSAFPETAENAGALLEAAEGALAEAGSAGGVASCPAELLDATGAEENDLVEAPDELLDPLTGILRWDRFGAAARKFLARRLRENRPSTVMLLEIDKWEDVNARHGQAAGDAMLRRMGGVLNRRVRETDLIGRGAGGGCVAILACDVAAAESAARRLLAALTRDPVEAGSARVRPAVNVALAAAPGDGLTWPVLLRGAEAALRHGRREGSNRTTRFAPAMLAVGRRADRPRDEDVF
jgi:diguanylate cyclase (GGDEF)-like protein